MKKISGRKARLGFFSMLIIFLFSLTGAISGLITYNRAVKYSYLTTLLAFDMLILIILFIFILWLVIKNR